MNASNHSSADALRIDRWLFCVRLFKTRSAAADAVTGGKVHLNGERIKPSHSVRPGDSVAFVRNTVLFECQVAAVPLRRGPASEAVRAYEETAASQARREAHTANMKVASSLAIRPAGRPDKHGRKLLRQMRGRS